MSNIEKIALESNSINDAVEKICEKNSQIDAKILKKSVEDVKAKMIDYSSTNEDSLSEELVDLDGEDLEAVAGGSEMGIGTTMTIFAVQAVASSLQNT